MDRGASLVTVHGVTKSQTRLSDSHFHSILNTLYFKRRETWHSLKAASFFLISYEAQRSPLSPLLFLSLCSKWTAQHFLQDNIWVPPWPWPSSASVPPSCSVAWLLAQGCNWATGWFMSLFPHLSGVAALHCLMSSVLKLLLHAFDYFRQAAQSGPCFSILSGSRSLPWPLITFENIFAIFLILSWLYPCHVRYFLLSL